MTEAEARHHRSCGACSGIPACCVRWFVRMWLHPPINAPWRRQYAALFAVANAYLPEPRYYIACPLCLLTGRTARIRECSVACGCWTTALALTPWRQPSVKPRHMWSDKRERQEQERFAHAHADLVARVLAPLVRFGTRLAMRLSR